MFGQGLIGERRHRSVPPAAFSVQYGWLIAWQTVLHRGSRRLADWSGNAQEARRRIQAPAGHRSLLRRVRCVSATRQAKCSPDWRMMLENMLQNFWGKNTLSVWDRKDRHPLPLPPSLGWRATGGVALSRSEKKSAVGQCPEAQPLMWRVPWRHLDGASGLWWPRSWR